MCWLSAPWPPISSIGLSARQRVGDAGDGVGGARAGGDDGAAGPAGDARVAVGGVGRDLLVADVDDLDALVDAAVVDVDDVAAAEGEDRVDALGLQGLRDQVAAGDRLGWARRAIRRSAPCSWRSLWCSFRRPSRHGRCPLIEGLSVGVASGRERCRWSVSQGGRPCARRGRPGSARGRARGARRARRRAASSASMMCMWSTIERSARSSSPIVRPRIARTCTSRPSTMLEDQRRAGRAR